MRIKRSLGDVTMDIVVYTFLILLSLSAILPFMQVITISLSPSEMVNKFGLHFIPTKFDLHGYKTILEYKLIWTAYGNTILRVVLGTSLSLLLMIFGAYPLSRRYLPHRTFWTAFVVFTMFFHGGLIPTYLLVRGMGLYNTIGALIFPAAINTFSLIIVRNFFMTLPSEVEESAKMDGANDIVILFKIIIPMSMAILATVGLWSAVWHWNAWFDSMIYIRDEKKYVLQYVLRKIILDGQSDMDTNSVNTETMKMAALIVATLPILCVYPFLQKYFVKGVMVGSVKG